VPWSAGGAFTTGAIGIETLAYAPFAFACWISPLIGLLYASLNWFMPKATEAEKRQWVRNNEPIMIQGDVISGREFEPGELEKKLVGNRLAA